MVQLPRTRTKKSGLLLTGLLLTALVCSSAGEYAGAAVSQTIGPVTIVYKHFTYTGSSFTAEGGVTLTSTSFNLVAQTVVVYLGGKAGPGGTGITKATADGDPSAGKQVVGRFDDLKQGHTYKFYADHAVYKPDPSKPSGGTVDFTGNVTMSIAAPDALAEPSITHLKHAIVTLGSGPDYPRIDGDEGQTVLTPLH